MTNGQGQDQSQASVGRKLWLFWAPDEARHGWFSVLVDHSAFYVWLSWRARVPGALPGEGEIRHTDRVDFSVLDQVLGDENVWVVRPRPFTQEDLGFWR